MSSRSATAEARLNGRDRRKELIGLLPLESDFRVRVQSEDAYRVGVR